MIRPLSKSQYTRGLQCLKSLWLHRNEPKVRTPTDPGDQAILDAGTAFGVLAQKLFPGGVLIHGDRNDPEALVAETKAAIAAGATVLFEAAFLHDDVLVRADIVVLSPNGWLLYEVKSSTEVKDVFLHDVAIQRHVMAGAGFPTVRAYILHANPGYVRQGDLELSELITVYDATEVSFVAAQAVPRALATMKQVAALAEQPDVDVGPHCTKPYPCDFKEYCFNAKGVPEYSVFNLAGARMDKKLELWNAGAHTLNEIPAGTKLSPTQTAQVAVAKSGKPKIDRAAIAGFLGTLRYPLAFLDFETDNPVVPPFDGLRPYQQMPFQAALYVRPELGAPAVRHDFLGDGRRDPRRDLISFLFDEVPKTGSIIAYNKSFEGGCLVELAGFGGPSAGGLFSFEKRLWDLAEPFRKAQYAHPAFKGSWSIKAVLPVLAPRMSYDRLMIKNGVEAQLAYKVLATVNLPPEDREKLREALLIYCGQDSFAMVVILDELHRLLETGVAA